MLSGREGERAISLSVAAGFSPLVLWGPEAEEDARRVRKEQQLPSAVMNTELAVKGEGERDLEGGREGGRTSTPA